MTDVRKLLNKRKFTGEDLGRIEITSMAVSFKNALEGNNDAPAFIDTDKFLALINALDRNDLRVYNNYIEIHDWLTMKYNIAQSSYNLALLQLKVVFNYLSDFNLTEHFANYIEKLQTSDAPPVPQIIKETSIRVFFEDSEEFEKNSENLLNAINVFNTSYYLLVGYNKAIDLIAEEYGLPDTIIFKRDFSKIHEQIQNINDLRNNLYKNIANNTDNTLKNKKLYVLDKYFKNIDVSYVKISDKKINTAKALLKDFRAFKMPAQDPLYELLFLIEG